MAGIAGTRTTASDTTAQKRYVMDLIDTYSIEDFPFTKLLPKGPAFTNPKLEWDEDSLFPLSVTVTSGLNAGSTNTTTFSCSANDTAYLHVGQILQIDSEAVWISGISGNTVTIVREFNAVTATTHADASIAYDRGTATLENGAVPQLSSMPISFPYNYPQSFEGYCEVGQRAQNTERYGNSNDLNYQIDQRLKEQLRGLEQTLFYGIRHDGSANAAATGPYAMSGIPYYISTNATAAGGAALTQKMILDTMQLCYYAVGPEKMGMTIVCGAWAMRKIADMFQPYVTFGPDNELGGLAIYQLTVPFGKGKAKLLCHPFCPTNALYILNLDKIKLCAYKGGEWQLKDMPESKAAIAKRLYGDWSVVVMGELCHGKVTGFSTTT